jgi:hypothetical protein
MEWQSIVNSVFNWGIVIVILVFLVVLIGVGVYFYSQSKKFKQFRCIIFSKDALNNALMEIDDAGIFTDKSTNSKRFFLRKHNVGLDPDKVRHVQSGNQKFVYLRKYSTKNFAFIDVTSLLKEIPELFVTEQDVNWAIHDYRKHKALDKKNPFMEFAGPITFGFAVIATLILCVWLFKQFDVLKDVAGAISTASESLKQAAQQIAAAQSGTKIIP